MTDDASMARARESISAKIDYLFRTVRREDGREFTYEDVERGTKGRVSRSYVWKLRHGRNRNPSLDVLEALGEFFSVPPHYFFGGEVSDDPVGREVAEVAGLLRDPASRLVADRARGLSPTALQALGNLIESLHVLENGRGQRATRSGVDRPTEVA
jgi:transcriptional regulator with XRE-family HTH domain